jgi:hypothetical protein
MTNLQISEHTYGQLENFAKHNHVSADYLAEEAIQRHLHDLRVAAIEREVEEYARQHTDIYEQYANEYIAMYEGKVIDHDTNELTLFVRIDERLPDMPVLITKVTKRIIEEYAVHSPRIVKEE